MVLFFLSLPAESNFRLLRKSPAHYFHCMWVGQFGLKGSSDVFVLLLLEICFCQRSRPHYQLVAFWPLNGWGHLRQCILLRLIADCEKVWVWPSGWLWEGGKSFIFCRVSRGLWKTEWAIIPFHGLMRKTHHSCHSCEIWGQVLWKQTLRQGFGCMWFTEGMLSWERR